MAESRERARNATRERVVVQGAAAGQVRLREIDIQAEAETSVNVLQQGMANLNPRQPIFPIFVFNQYFGPVVHGDVQGNLAYTTNIQDSQVDSVGGQSSSQNVQVQSPPGMSEAQLREYQTGALLHLLNGLNLRQFEQPILGALQGNNAPSTAQHAIEQSNIETGRIESSPADIDVPVEAVMKRICDMKLDEDVGKLVEEAFIALIRDDESEKSTFDLISAYNEECASIMSSFYTNRQDLKELTTKSWTNYLLEMVSSISDRHLRDTNEMKRVLARICGVLSKQLQQQNNDDSYQKRFVSRADDVLKMGRDFASNKKPIHAMFAFYTAAKLYKLENNGNESANKIRTCGFGPVILVGERVIEHQAIITDHVIPLIRKMQSYFNSVNNLTRVVRTEGDAWCLADIAVCYFLAGKDQECMKEVESAMGLVETKIKKRATNYKLYGSCLRLSGFVHIRIGNISKATQMMELALKAYRNVKDWESDEKKNRHFKYVQEDLMKLKAMRKKKKDTKFTF